MVSSHGNNAHSDTARMEQIITEFLAKSLHIILESRTLSRKSYGVRRPRDKWFHLALDDCPAPAALENIHLRPIIFIDVILVHRPISPKRSYSFNEQLGVEEEAKSTEKIVERWIVQHETGKIKESRSSSRRSSINISLKSVYRKSILLLRSLYATLRLLPAYKIFRDLNNMSATAKNITTTFTLAHRVSSFVEPFTQKQESEMMKFEFKPVDTFAGSLCLTVMYCPLALDFNFISHSHPLPSVSPPLVISDYFGSPLVNPLPCPLSKVSSVQKKDVISFDHHHHPASVYYSCVSIVPISMHNADVANPPGCSNRQKFPPSLPLRDSRCTSNKIDRRRRRSTNIVQTTSEKLFSIGKSEPQKYSGVSISANSLPHISISRNSSRSYQDDFEDTDFSCPFDLNDDDIKDPGSRRDYLDHGHVAEAPGVGGFLPIRFRKSHDASVGALVHMLKKAPPLAQEPNQIIEAPRPASLISSEIIATRKTTNDALENIHAYKEMKKLLLLKGNNKPQL